MPYKIKYNTIYMTIWQHDFFIMLPVIGEKIGLKLPQWLNITKMLKYIHNLFFKKFFKQVRGGGVD